MPQVTALLVLLFLNEHRHVNRHVATQIQGAREVLRILGDARWAAGVAFTADSSGLPSLELLFDQTIRQSLSLESPATSERQRLLQSRRWRCCAPHRSSSGAMPQWLWSNNGRNEGRGCTRSNQHVVPVPRRAIELLTGI